ncbi:O-antigen ligase [Pseudoruegeria sp. HB172150]|uniref:O-antigen ligase family protein n=1 Tax=Pseudoruegeria sp. HB172150 TaxID=2721164 RepID=UPI0015577CD4|nr:O-antigen ligase family protein [Pseudoruegeria sp. HB172150]
MTQAEIPVGRLRVPEATIDAWLGFGVLLSLIMVPALGKLAVLGLLGCGMMLIVMRPASSLSALLRHWYVMLMPLFCTASAIWSRLPEESFRAGIQLSVSAAIAVVLATRMPLRSFIAALFFGLGTMVVMGFLFGNVRGDTGALLGFYNSKNAMAGAGALFGLVAFAVAAIPGYGKLSWVAAACVPIAVYTVYLAQSVSALAVLPLGIGGYLLATQLHRFGLSARIVIILFAVLFALLVGVLVAMHWNSVVGGLLDATGKDLTLTGRTDLWREAFGFISERPLLGIGFNAFWTRGHAPAEALWLMFGIESRSGFNFHNTYFSNAVEIGIIGTGMQVLMILASVALPLWRFIQTGDQTFAFLFGSALMLLVTTMVEVPIFIQFSLRTFLVFTTLVYAVEGRSEAMPERTGPRSP